MTIVVRYIQHRHCGRFLPAQVTSKHKNCCFPCQKWAVFVYSLFLNELAGLDTRGFWYNLESLIKLI